MRIGQRRSKTVLLLIAMAFGLSWCFYRSLWGLLVMVPGIPFVVKELKRRWQLEQEMQMGREFSSFLQSLGAALAVGNSMDGAFREATAEFMQFHEDKSLLAPKLQRLLAGRSMQKPLDLLVKEMAEDTGVKEMVLFARVFQYANHCGGDFRELVQRTAGSIRQKQQLNQEIENALTGKALELKIMAITPLGILIYIGLANPGYLDPLYHNLSGTLIMTGCLVVYLASVLWGLRIVSIKWDQ